MLDGFDGIVCLDVETSGLDSRRDCVIELGALKTLSLDAEPTERISTLIRMDGGRRLPPKITEITGITYEMLQRDGIDRREAAEALADMLEGNNLVLAYNAQFDMVFIYYLLSSVNRQSVLKGVKMLDVLTVYKDRRDYPHRLENAIESYKLPASNTHRAIDDADAALKLTEAMGRERDDLEHYINLFGYNPRFGIAGQRISSVRYAPQPYNSDVPLYERVETAVK